MIRRDWTAASRKIADEGGACRNCGTTRRVERAHITERANDRKPPLGWDRERDGEWHEPCVVHPDRVIPLCGPSTDPSTCHGADHAKTLDLLPLLTVAEQAQAVADAGGIELARIRLAPSAYPERREHRLRRAA